jgi:hypothetical protein
MQLTAGAHWWRAILSAAGSTSEGGEAGMEQEAEKPGATRSRGRELATNELNERYQQQKDV